MNAAPSTNTTSTNTLPGWRLFFQVIFPTYLFVAVVIVMLRRRVRCQYKAIRK